MDTITGHAGTLVHADGVTIDVGAAAAQDVAAALADGGAATGTQLLDAAVRQARARGTHRLRAVVEAADPGTSRVVEALHARVGDSVESIALRRAGSSVVVTLELLPLPPAHAAPRHTGARPRTERRAAPARPPAGPLPRAARDHTVRSGR